MSEFELRKDLENRLDEGGRKLLKSQSQTNALKKRNDGKLKMLEFYS